MCHKILSALPVAVGQKSLSKYTLKRKSISATVKTSSVKLYHRYVDLHTVNLLKSDKYLS